ncbi:hypothetical protein C9374_002738 [Naegleria lovaniensis]|uniref:Endonuclease/exonuclease/phosphatase domain-containing protein n=1 Tax=Naegleria lovaniensis TaxID=51637 RepID=A0AA88KQC0_NAELO|nr:uncharacterized protein C9374_002738 [Naegleria lovaniensis]KAG2386292.1 hypothetical protein C9374_002738 [Naegleria lovaniensis]
MITSSNSNTTIATHSYSKECSISCCTFNVHSFKTDGKVDNRQLVLNYFIENQYDIIGMNEAYEKLKKIKKKYLKRGPGGPRTVVGVQFEGNSCVEFAFVTHLDYIQETMRIQQLAEVMNFMAEFMQFDLSSPQKAPKYVLMGDFNAMNRKEYTSDFWKFLQDMRDKRKWEPVSSDLMNCLFDTRNQVQKHHKILSKLAQQLAIIDPWRQKNKDKLFDGTPNTSSSRFHTRIDYILCSQAMQTLVSESYIDLRENTLLISDHNPVVVRLVSKNDDNI